MSKIRFRSITLTVLVALVAVSAVVWVGCSNDQSSVNAPTENIGLLKLNPDAMPDLARAIGIQNKYTDQLLAKDGVVGTGVGLGADGNLAVKVFTKRAGVQGIPGTLDGLPVEIDVTGEFRAMALKGRYRPVPIGVSVGNNLECASGTIGCVVLKGGNKYILSNNHVLARENAASIGEDIVQPGRYDNHPICTDHGATDKVADLSDFQAINFSGGDNTIDAAIAQYSTTDVTCSTPAGFYGFPSSTTVAPSVGLAVKKVGRTSSLTTGTITAINATVNVGYSAGTATFINQIVTSSGMIKSGDSGSLLVTNDANNNPVGLMFAGTNNGTAIANPIGPVLSKFGVSICSN